MRSFARKNPSLALFVALVPGLLLAEAGAVGSGLLLELLLAAAVAVAGRPRMAAAIALLACLFLGRAFAARTHRLAEVAAWRAQPAGPLVLTGRAEALGPASGGRSRVLFRVRGVARADSAERRADPAVQSRAGWVRLFWGGPRNSRRGLPAASMPPVGRSIAVRGLYRPARRAENPGTLDWGLLPGGPRLRGSLHVESWSFQRSTGAPFLQGLRERLSARIDRLFPPLSGGFMRAALLGDREGLDPRLREVFGRTGTGHIVAISGMNVAIIAAIGWAVLSPVVPQPRRRRRLLACALLLYVPLAGGSPSVARAAFMGVGILWAQGSARRVLLPNALGAAGMAVVLLQPEALLDPSFQLSFAAVLGLAMLPRTSAERWPRAPGSSGRGGPGPIRRGSGIGARLAGKAAGSLARGALDLARVTAASLVATLPLTLGYFRHLPLLSLPANLVVVPALGALTAGGFAALTASLAWPELAALYARACDLLLLFVFRGLELCARPSWAWLAIPGPRGALMTGGLCAALLATTAARLRGRRAAVTVAGGLLLLGFVPALLPSSRPRLEIAVLAVGQGDAIVLILPGGEALLVDGGPAEAGGEVVAFLHERGVGQLARAFATHPDGDHVGGLESVLSETPADSVHDAGQWGSGGPYRRFLERSYAVGAGYRPLRAGDRLQHGAVTIDVLWPPAGYAGRDPYWEGFATNDASLVLLIGYRSLRILLAGDVGGEVERMMAAAYADSLASDFLKVAHHGSRSSSAGEFLRAVRADVALLSVGRDNRYRHPHREAIARLAPRRIWRTDRDGALLLSSDGRTYELRGYVSGRVERRTLEPKTPRSRRLPRR